MSKPVDGDAEEAGQDKEKASTDGEVKDPDTSGDKDGEGERKEDKKGGQMVEAKSCETERDGDEMKDKNKEKDESKTEEKSKEAEKEKNKNAAKGSEKKKQAKNEGAEMKDKGKIKEVEKQGKPKRKTGPPSSALSRPRPSARSIRAAARNDILAKFQQGGPE